MVLNTVLDSAIGVGIDRDIGVGHDAYPYPAAYPNLRAEAQSLFQLLGLQMNSYISITGIPERKHVWGLLNTFDSAHFLEVQPYKAFSNFPRKAFPFSKPAIFPM